MFVEGSGTLVCAIERAANLEPVLSIFQAQIAASSPVSKLDLAAAKFDRL